MSSRTRVTSVVASIACLGVAAVAPLAHAGGGPGAGELPTGTFVCRGIQNGANPTHVFSVVQGPLTQEIQLGRALVVCEPLVPTTVTLESGPELLSVSEGEIPAPNAVTCYAATPTKKSPQDPAVLSDPLGIGEGDITGFEMVCVPSHRG